MFKIIDHETIECPECNHIQDAPVQECFPWNIRVHYCEKCHYLIMESEWNVVTNGKEEE
jgi:RNase P subunit RPR2